jgi:hypothetical protein
MLPVMPVSGRPDMLQRAKLGASRHKDQKLYRKRATCREESSLNGTDERSKRLQEAEPNKRSHVPILQAEFSLPQVLDRPLNGRVFFEEVIRENLDIGRPSQVQLIFDRRVTRQTPGRFRTRGSCCNPRARTELRLRQEPVPPAETHTGPKHAHGAARILPAPDRFRPTTEEDRPMLPRPETRGLKLDSFTPNSCRQVL